MKAEILASMIHKPKILFLDEPTIGLDIISKKKILDIIKKLNEEENVTVFLTSHDMSDIERLCNRVIIIDKGTLIVDSQISDLKDRYAKTKTVTISYDNISQEALKEFNVLSFDSENNVAVVEISKKSGNVSKEISKLISLGEVSDIKIDETSLEKVIEDIYKEGVQNE